MIDWIKDRVKDSHHGIDSVLLSTIGVIGLFFSNHPNEPNLLTHQHGECLPYGSLRVKL